MNRHAAVEYRPPADDREQAELVAIVDQSFAEFGRPGAARRLYDWLGRDHARVALVGGRVVAGLGLMPFSQWFGGRLLRSVGVTCVGVAPEARGCGAGAAMMQALVRELAGSGAALTTLYPSTWPVYRNAGYEMAGARVLYELEIARIRHRQSEPPLVPLGVQDAPRMQAMLERIGPQRNGEVLRSVRRWEFLLTPPDQRMYAYGVPSATEPGGLDAFLTYTQKPFAPAPYEIEVRDILVAAPVAGRRLLSFFGDHGTMSRIVRFGGMPAEPLAALSRDRCVEAVRSHEWMMRVLDVRAALTQRGYAPGVRGALAIEVDDPLIAANRGRMVLHVQDGVGRIEEGGEAAGGLLRADIRGLAALFSGHRTAEELALLELAQGEPETLAVATSLFSGRAPGMSERF